MTREELWDALDGLHAYDAGCADSGIRDEALRQRAIDHLESLDDVVMMRELGTFVRETYLTEEKMNLGYDLENVKRFIDWLSSTMGIDI